ncbi:hypothetical protein niasHT_018116 [Heterodera trifolii]|uniref:Transposase n=1 Tax=Heterodera trifolii TaxID=157864 RepID=A0ABD2L4K3_9BILA
MLNFLLLLLAINAINVDEIATIGESIGVDQTDEQQQNKSDEHTASADPSTPNTEFIEQKARKQKNIKPKRVYTEAQKYQIIHTFDQIKKEFRDTFDVSFSNRILEDKLAKKFDLHSSTINRWKCKLGIAIKRDHTDAERYEIVKQYHKIKEQKPNLRNIDIAEQLNISETSLRNWRRKFEEKFRISH